MLEKNPELNQPEQELVADDAVKTFRKIIQKKHTEETQETEERASVFSYAATACLVLADSVPDSFPAYTPASADFFHNK